VVTEEALKLSIRSSGSREEDPASRPVKIFLVEDHAPDVFLVEKALREHNVTFELIRFEDGEQALEDFRQWEPDTAPDLIILDLNVPKIDGMDLLRAIRSDPAGTQIPIAVLTSSRAVRDKVDAMALGADRFITKPFDLRSFVGIVGASIKELIAEKKARATSQNGD
jgi:DNA-binding response OmpR family regulator